VSAPAQASVLIPTSRSQFRLVSYVTVIAVEDAMRSVADVDLVDVPQYSRRGRVRELAGGRLREPRVTAPREHYDLGFFVAMDATWIASLRFVEGLRERCGRVVAYVFDAWLSDLKYVRRYRRQWNLCDTVYISYPWALDAYARELDCEVVYLPQAASAAHFHPNRVDRAIDILSIGRRLPEAHALFLELARRHDLFYHYSEARAPVAYDHSDSQLLLDRLCQSAKAQVCWPVELTTPRRGEGAPVTVRWFEAAACASVVLGGRPAAPDFDELFPYPNFVVELDPRDPREFERRVLAALRSDDRRERVELAEHVRTHHSWEARCETMLGTRPVGSVA
jgi:hypothetical protein